MAVTQTDNFNNKKGSFMKNFTFASSPKVAIMHLLLTLLLFSFASASCTASQTDSLKKDSQKYLSFYETVDGELVHWEVNFEKDKIISIYKNGEKIPDDLVADYKDKVFDQIDEMRFGEKKFSFRMHAPFGKEFCIDMDRLQKELEELEKDLPGHKEKLRLHYFDSEEFKKELEELKERLRELKPETFNWKFDDEKFREKMKEFGERLRESLPKPEDFQFYFEWEEQKDIEV
jgi:hypothetical protein